MRIKKMHTVKIGSKKSKKNENTIRVCTCCGCGGPESEPTNTQK